MSRPPQRYDETRALRAFIAGDAETLGVHVLALARNVAASLSPPLPPGSDWRDDEGVAIEVGWRALELFNPDAGSLRNYLTKAMVREIRKRRALSARDAEGIDRLKRYLGEVQDA